MNHYILRNAGPSDIQKISDDAQSIHISRVDGLGDLLFMQPALRKFKQQHSQAHVVLHTHADRAYIGNFLDVDEVIVSNNKIPKTIINLNWALEAHPAMRCMDRVSLWEKVLQVPVGDEQIEVRRKISYKHGCEALACHPHYHHNKPNLYYAPNAAHQGRELQSQILSDTVAQVSLHYNVIYITNDEPKVGPEWSHVLQYPWATLEDFHTLLCGCDGAWCTDTGGLYFAAAMGIPSVGIYDHVAPWLRIKRVPNILALYTRLEGCKCDHHSPCTQTSPFCREAVTAEILLPMLSQAIDENVFGTYNAWSGQKIEAPRLAIIADEETCDIKYMFAGLNYDVVQAPDPIRHKFVLDADACATCSSPIHYWAALDDLLYPRTKEVPDLLHVPGRPAIVPLSYYDGYVPCRYIMMQGNIDNNWAQKELAGGATPADENSVIAANDIVVFTGAITAEHAPIFHKILSAGGFIEVRMCTSIDPLCYVSLMSAITIETIDPVLFDELLQENLPGRLTKCPDIAYGGTKCLKASI